jgi:hypothetical protein
MKKVILILVVVSLSSCASNQKKYAAKVDCKEDEAIVREDHSMSMVYESVLVECKGKTYRCTETALGTSDCAEKK